MLLPRLKRKPDGWFAGHILRDTNEATRHLPFVFLSGRQKRSMGSTEADGNTEALCRTDGNVGAELPGRAEQGQGEKVSGNRYENTGLMRLVDDVLRR